MTGIDAVAYLDRRLENTSPGVTVAYTPIAGLWATRWTLPYSVAVDGSEGTLVVCSQAPAAILGLTRYGPNVVGTEGSGSFGLQDDYSDTSVVIGILYPFSYKFSTIYRRDTNGVADTTGRLTLRRFLPQFDELTDAKVVVTHGAGQRFTTAKTNTRPVRDSMRVPLHGTNTETTIEVRSESAGGCALAGFDWEATHSTRSRRG